MNQPDRIKVLVGGVSYDAGVVREADGLRLVISENAQPVPEKTVWLGPAALAALAVLQSYVVAWEPIHGEDAVKLCVFTSDGKLAHKHELSAETLRFMLEEIGNNR